MEHVRFGSDFKNQPRIGHRYIQSTAGAVSSKTEKGKNRLSVCKTHTTKKQKLTNIEDRHN